MVGEMFECTDMQITGLLCSRLCHELAGPIGAINNGIEMIEEFDDSMLPDALPLIGASAKLVAARLSFYRMAYGAAGTQAVASVEDIMELANPYFSEGRIELFWPAESVDSPVFEDGWGRLFLNLLPLAADTLPRGGTLSTLIEDDSQGIRFFVIAEGEAPRIPDECDHAMSDGVRLEELTPRSVHAYFVSRLSNNLKSTIDVKSSTAGRIEFSVRLAR